MYSQHGDMKQALPPAASATFASIAKGFKWIGTPDPERLSALHGQHSTTPLQGERSCENHTPRISRIIGKDYIDNCWDNYQFNIVPTIIPPPPIVGLFP